MTFVAHVFGTIHLSRHPRKGSFQTVMPYCWGGEERGGDVDLCKSARIRSTLNQFRNEN